MTLRPASQPPVQGVLLLLCPLEGGQDLGQRPAFSSNSTAAPTSWQSPPLHRATSSARSLTHLALRCLCSLLTVTFSGLGSELGVRMPSGRWRGRRCCVGSWPAVSLDEASELRSETLSYFVRTLPSNSVEQKYLERQEWPCLFGL